jgi:hypothetical protein
MAIPMCNGARHVFIVGRELCRCGQERSLALDPRETRIAGLVVKETWSTIEVGFWPRPDGDGIEVQAHCARCGRLFFPSALVSTQVWKRMASPSQEAKDAQQAIAAHLAKTVNESPCGCRVASIWARQGTKLLLS